MDKKIKIYLATSLTHTKDEDVRNGVRQLNDQLKKISNVLEWAFDLETWTSAPNSKGQSVHDADLASLNEADIVAGLYLESAGSDGRGGEIVTRLQSGKPLMLIVKTGVVVSPFILGEVVAKGWPVAYCDTFDQMYIEIEAFIKKYSVQA